MKGSEVLELNVQPEHVHFVAMIPLQLLISTQMGVLKGCSAIRRDNRLLPIRKKR